MPLLLLRSSPLSSLLTWAAVHLSAVVEECARGGVLPVLFIQSHTLRHIFPLFFLSSPRFYYFLTFSAFLPNLFLVYNILYFMGSRNNLHSFGQVNTPRALSFSDPKFFYATLWHLWWWSPGWWLAKWAEEFHSVQQGYTSFVKQAVFNYPSNTIITVNVNFNEKLICTPIGYHTFRATHKQDFGCYLFTLVPENRAGAEDVDFFFSLSCFHPCS